MSTGTESATLVQDDTSTYERAADAVIAVCVATFVLNWVALFELVTLGDTVAGVRVFDLFVGSLFLSGASVLAFGAASAAGVVDTDPDASAGPIAAALFGAIWFVAGGLVGSQTLGLGTVGWLGVGLATGLVAVAVTLVPREDVGSTVPAAALTLVLGAVFAAGIIGPEWRWVPAGLDGGFLGAVWVPLLSAFASLVVGWSAAKASRGFGIRGRQRGAFLLIWLVVAAVLSVLAILIVFIVARGYKGVIQGASLWPLQVPFLTNGAGLLTETKGIYPAITGTIWLVVGAVTLAVPLGVGAAVFLTEYAEQGRFTQFVETATNGLWSTPSIVFGLFGYAFFVTSGRIGNGKSVVSGMLVLGFMLLPLVLITSREAIKSVPDEYRDASAALGVSKWETVRSVVLPAAMPGVITGIILGVGRIAGETAPILLVTAGGVVPRKQFAVNSIPDLFDAASALPYQLYALYQAGLNPARVAKPEQFAWGVTLVLLLVVMSFYAVGIVSRIYFRRKLNYE